MKELRITVARWAGTFLMTVGALWVVGCQTSQEHHFADVEGATPAAAATERPRTDVFQIGDVVGISWTFTVTPPLIPPYDERIRDDGTITPPFIGPVKAVDRTAGDLQRDLQERYEKFYRNVQVTVKTGERYFHVDGEVVRSGASPYLPETDIVKAIAAAGGFTEFASKRRIRLIRSTGKTEIINYNNVIRNPENRYYVYPGDKIWVPRRLF